MYQKTNWQNHVTQYENRYREYENPDGTFTHEPVEGEIIQEGTPQNAANFNNIESGILDSQTALSLIALDMHLFKDTIGTVEIGTATLTNTSKFPFNNSRTTVPLAMRRLSLDYGVEIIDAVAPDAKPIGDITVSNRQLNGFALSYSGSAASVTIKYRITGGITV